MDPISELQTLCQRLKLPAPRYEFSSPSAAAAFVCTVHVPALHSTPAHGTAQEQPAAEQPFVGKGTTKKAAKAAAAQAAMASLRTHPHCQAGTAAAASDASLWAAVEQALSNQGLYKEPMLRPHVLWAQAHGQPMGAVPASALLQARPVKAWLKAHAAESVGDASAMTHVLVQQLMQERQERQMKQKEHGSADIAAVAKATLQAAPFPDAVEAAVAAAATCAPGPAGPGAGEGTGLTAIASMVVKAEDASAPEAASTATLASDSASDIEVLGNGARAGLSVRRLSVFGGAGRGIPGHMNVLRDEVHAQQPTVVLLPAAARQAHLRAIGI